MKYEKTMTITFALMLLFLCLSVIKIYGVIIRHQLEKPKVETTYSADVKSCKILIDGMCVPMRADTNISISQLAGYDTVYEVQITYMTADVPQQKEPERKTEVKR